MSPPPEPAETGDLGEATARSAQREDGWGGGIYPKIFTEIGATRA